MPQVAARNRGSINAACQAGVWILQVADNRFGFVYGFNSHLLKLDYQRASMTLPVTPTADDLTSSNEYGTLEDERDMRPAMLQFVSGLPVCVKDGPFVGLRGVIDDQAPDGRWVIRLIDMQPGVYLCIHSCMLSYA